MWNGHILANNGEAVEVGNGSHLGAKSGLIVKKTNGRSQISTINLARIVDELLFLVR
jgi:hypothetical protein